MYILLVSISIFFICLLAGERVAVLNVIILIFYIFFIIDSNKLKKYFFSILLVISLFVFSTENPIKERLVHSTIESFTVKEPLQLKVILYFSEIHHSHILSAYKMLDDIRQWIKFHRYLCNKEKYRINDFHAQLIHIILTYFL